MVEIPLSKIGAIVLIAALTVGGGFGIQHLWKKHHKAKAVVVAAVPAPEPTPPPTHYKTSRRRHSIPGPHRRYVPPVKGAELPGVAESAPSETSTQNDSGEESPKPKRKAAAQQPDAEVPAADDSPGIVSRPS